MFCVSQIWWECIIKQASIDYIPRVQGSVFFMNIPDLSYNLSFQFLWHLKLNFSVYITSPEKSFQWHMVKGRVSYHIIKLSPGLTMTLS